MTRFVDSSFPGFKCVIVNPVAHNRRALRNPQHIGHPDLFHQNLQVRPGHHHLVTLFDWSKEHLGLRILRREPADTESLLPFTEQVSVLRVGSGGKDYSWVGSGQRGEIKYCQRVYETPKPRQPTRPVQMQYKTMAELGITAPVGRAVPGIFC